MVGKRGFFLGHDDDELVERGATPSVYSDGQDVTFGATASQFNINIVTAPGDSTGGPGVTPNSVTVTDNAGQTYTIGGDPINGTGTFTKTGLGAVTLTGNNTFTGAIVIKQGTVNVSSFDGPFGSGNLGNGNGQMTLGDATLNSTGTLNFTGNTSQFLLNSLATAGTGGIMRCHGSAVEHWRRSFRSFRT